MKIAPRSLMAAKKMTLPSGLSVSVLPSPSLIKLVRLGKVPAPLIKKYVEQSVEDVEAADLSPEEILTRLEDAAAFQAALVLAVVESVHYVDVDGTVYDLPLTLDAATDECYPYDLMTPEDANVLFEYAQEGTTELATFPVDARGVGGSEDSGSVESKTKRTARAK